MLASSRHTRARATDCVGPFYKQMFTGLYPLYLVSLLLVMVNFLVFCNPATFEHVAFVQGGSLVCAPPPAIKGVPWATVLPLTVVVYTLGLQTLPFRMVSRLVQLVHLRVLLPSTVFSFHS